MFAFLFALIKTDIQKSNNEFEHAALPHIDALYNFALNITDNKSSASKLLQETYLEAYRFWNMLDPDTNCKAWLFRIMRNAYIKSYRKKTKEPEKIDYEEIERQYEDVRPSSKHDTCLEKDVYTNILDDELSAAISSLPEDFKMVLIMYDIIGYSYDETSDFVDVPLGTVRSRLNRARKILFTNLYKSVSHKDYVNTGNKD
jgi:RNA polymerase sigma-70 factor, ECF subfamily